MLRTILTERYGIGLPFVSAGMGFIATPPLVASVSNAGGFGLLACGESPPGQRCEDAAAADPPQSIGTTVLGGQEYVMPKFSAILPTPETRGDFDEMCLAAGESAAVTNAIATVEEVVQTMSEQARGILERQRPAASRSAG